MKIAMSGANGFIGEHLSKLLLLNPSNHLVKLGRKKIDANDNFINIEKMSPSDIAAKLQGFDCFIHLASRAHTNNSTEADFQRDNVALTIKLTAAAKEANIKHFIYLSSIKVNGNTTRPGKAFSADDIPAPADLYGKSKLASERAITEMLANTNIALTIVRPPLVWGQNCKGNLRTLIKMIEHGVPLPFGAIKNRRDILSLDNLCDFIGTLILNPAAANQIFLVSDEIPRSTKEIITLLESFSKNKAKLWNAPLLLFSLLKAIPSIRPRIESFSDNLEINTDKTRRILNWTPSKQ